MCADLNGCLPELLRQFLLVRLRGNAQEVFRNLNDAIRQDYDLFIAAIVSTQMDPDSQANSSGQKFALAAQATVTLFQSLDVLYAVWRV